MNRVLLVDDDPIVLIQLRKMIEWDKLNCELVAEAVNGDEAIRLIEQYHPQVVITDISMPGINGVDLIQYLNHRNSKTQVIAISAFDDFSYVRESLKGGANDYLLKHQLTKPVLEKAIRNALSVLDENGTEIKFSVREKKERLMYRLLHSQLSDGDIRTMEELSLGWMKRKIILALGSFKVREKDNRDIVFVMMDEIIKYYQDYQILEFEKGKYLLIFSADDDRQQEIPDTVEQVSINIKRFCDIELSFVISDTISDYQEIERTVQQCDKILQEYYFCGKEGFVAFFQEKKSADGLRLSREQEMELIDGLYSDHEPEEIIEKLFAGINEEEYSKNQLQLFVVDIYNMFCHRIQDQEEGVEEIANVMSSSEEFLKLDTARAVKSYLTDQYRKMQNLIRKRKSTHYCELVKQAVQYINQNYKDRISLSSVARVLSVSDSYLSRCFKKDTGTNIVSYINKIRMEHARKLIDEGKMSLNEIAYEVGIQNYN